MMITTRGFARATNHLQRRLASSSTKPPHKTPAIKTSPNFSPTASPHTARPYKPPARKPNPAPPPPPSKDPDTLQSLWRRSWLPLTGAAILAGFLGFYIVGTVTASLKTCPCEASTCQHATPTGRPPALTGDNAEQFDKELNLPEWWMGITKLRKKLADHARGDVLELAVGTGRNLEYYNWEPLSAAGTSQATRKSAKGITSFTGLDISIDMLDVARKRLVKTVPPMVDSEPIVKRSSMADQPGGQLSFLNNRLRLVHSDAHHPLPRSAMPSNTSASAAYDTIIQTFGLCSVSDPVAVLCNLASAVKPETGRIVLLEHGQGWSGVVNGLLDKNAEKHFEKYGCWWNRDIEALVDEAVRKTPGLEVVKLERPNILQMGTLVWVELRMRTEAVDAR